MKLVLTYDISDHCTYSYPNHIPFEYESKEKAEYDLYEEWQRIGRELVMYSKWEEKCPSTSSKQEKWKAWDKMKPNVNLNIKLGTIKELDVNDFTIYQSLSNKPREYNEPKIMTLDEWFNYYKE